MYKNILIVRFELDDNDTLSINNVQAADVATYECLVETDVDKFRVSASLYDESIKLLFLWILIAILIILVIVMCCCALCCVRAKSKSKGRYGVKDIEDGKAR